MINFFLMFVLYFIQVEQLETITKLQNKFEQIDYLIADFSQASASANSLRGKFYFSKPNNYRIELANNIIISDGTTIWNHDIKRNKVIISNVEDDPLSFSFSEYIYDYPQKCDVVEKNSGDEIVLTLSAVDTELNFEKVNLWINNEYLINKIKVVDYSSSSFTLLFNNIIINNKIADSKFTFIDNGDLKIIDLR